MRKFLLFIVCFVCFVCFNTSVFSQFIENNRQIGDGKELIRTDFDLSHGFEENKGQIFDEDGKFRSDVYFVSNISGASVFFTNEGVVFYFKKIESSEFDKIRSGVIPNPYSDKEWEDIMKQISNDEYKGDLINREGEFYRIDITFPGATFSSPLGENEMFEKRNYFNPQHPDGLMNIPIFESIRYANVYPGIDLIFYVKSGKLKYDFEISAKADPSLIKILYKGQENVSIDEEGNAVVKILPGQIIEDTPLSFQNGEIIESEFIVSNDTIMFQLGEYDRTQPVTIDPSLSWSTYFYDGSTSAASSYTNPVWDSDGNMFIVQNTYNNTNFPVINPGGEYIQTGGSTGLQLTIMKFNSSKQIVWATYYASSQSASLNYSNQCVTMDKNSNLYIIGSVFYVYANPPASFPLQDMGGGAYYETEQGNNRNFILKFSSAGMRLWATMFNKTSGSSSSGLDLCGITIDNNDKLVITGETYTPPSWNPMPLANPGGSHYYHGTSVESSVPTLHRFSATGVLEWSTYICQGAVDDYNGNNTAIDIDANNNIFIGGSGSGSYTTVNPGGAYVDGVACGNGRKIQIFKFANNGSLNWCTLYGGVYISGSMLWQDCRDLKVASNGDVILVGRANATNFPWYNPGGGAFYKNTLSTGSSAVCDGVILQFSNGGVRKWATYCGGNGISDGTDFKGLAIDENDNIFVSGISRTTNTFPTLSLAGSYNQSSQTGDYAVVLSQFNISGVQKWASYFGNKTYMSSGGLGLNSTVCGTTLVQCGVLDNAYTITTVDPGGGAYFHSDKEGASGQTDFIAEFDISNFESTPPTSISGTTTICSGDNTMLTAVGGISAPGATYQWYAGGCGSGAVLGIASALSVAPSTTTTYYVRRVGTCNTTSCANVTVTVNTNVGITSATATTSPICSSATTTITANGIVGTGATLTWYTGTGGTGTILGSANPLTVGPGTYYARVTGTCGSPVEASVTVDSNIDVGITSATAAASPICSSATTTITANGIVGTGATLTWYTGTGGTGTILGSANPLTVGPGTYYARV
ncbi:MAG: hypothetical protein RBR97_11295, partial [Bacteroidales bacterium]|nr:hypothetical protein [Bacteroidales bacterium]